MKRQIFFTGDTHFNHREAIKIFHRPFSNLQEMHQVLIGRWNKTAGPRDVVYHLGDFGFWIPLRGDLESFFAQLNGHKFLILGNHDNDQTVMLPWMGVMRAAKLKVNGNTLLLSHYPPTHQYEGDEWVVHAHSHGSLGNRRGLDVGVDCHQFYPVSEEQIRAFYAK